MKYRILIGVSVLLALCLVLPVSGLAAGEDELKNVLGERDIDKDKIYGDIQQIIYFIYGISGLVILTSVIVSSVLLSTSGSNPHKRAAGFGALGMAALGGYVLVKAFDIAAFLSTFASSGG
ncbi:MAG: hypothetical protein H0Z33_10865 [Bacillaceae bacterium]|nr:hypothetical protein [Bacillaceae bacterium]